MLMNPLRYNTVFEKSEIHLLLGEFQDGLCSICQESLDRGGDKEIDHEPPVWELKKKVFTKLFGTLGYILLEGEINETAAVDISNLCDDLLFQKIIETLKTQMYLRSVHKKCHKKKNRELSSQEKTLLKNAKGILSEDTYGRYSKTRKRVTSIIKGHRILSAPQMRDISVRRNETMESMDK